MKVLLAIALVLSAPSVNAQPLTQQFPSCDLKAQHALKGATGGTVKDQRQAHILMRGDILRADLGTARKARRLTQANANRLYKRVETIKAAANRYIRKQGFLSASDVASYDRLLDALTTQVCRR